MKKMLSLLLVGMMALGLFAACGNTDGSQTTAPGGNPSATTQDAAASPEAPGGNNAAEAPDDSAPMELNILNWGDYIDEEMLEAFKLEYPNISVNYEVTASNEEMLTLLQSGGSIYDLCFPSDYTIAKLIKLDLLAEIDQSQLSNLGNIDERFMDLEFDPGNVYSIPYHWGTVGILYNQTLVNEPVDNWSVLWGEQYRKQIFMYDSVRDSMGVALVRLGYSLNSTNPEEIKQAEDSLIQQKPLVQAYGIDDLRDKMVSGAGAFALVYSGDAVAAIEENDQLAYAVPLEGSNIWFDNVVVLKNSANKRAAHLFIDYLLRADVAAANASYIGYSTPNKAALELLPPEMAADEVFNPPQEIIDRCEAFVNLDDEVNNMYNDAWLRIKAS